MATTDSQWYPLTFINNFEDFVYMFSCSKNAPVISAEKPQVKIYIIPTWSDISFRGKIVDQALPSLHGVHMKLRLQSLKGFTLLRSILSSCKSVLSWSRAWILRFSSPTISSLLSSPCSHLDSSSAFVCFRFSTWSKACSRISDFSLICSSSAFNSVKREA